MIVELCRYFFIGLVCLAQTSNTEMEFKKLMEEFTNVTNEIQRDYENNNEEALYTFNLDKKVDPLYEKIKSFRELHPEYRKKFLPQIDKYNSLLDKINELHAKQLPATREKAINALNNLGNSLNKNQKKKEQETLESTVVSYDEWVTLQSTSIKSGKKYSFIACVNGQRDATAIKCNLPGSAAKRVFYNTDDIKDLDTKKRWINTINEMKCVTAYVTGGEAFIFNIKDENECK